MADKTWQKWHDELELTRKAKGYDQWQTRARKIIRRYRDDRVDNLADAEDRDVATGTKFNILWSNVQTLLPAMFGRTPKPIVERRYLDRDDVGRTASMILERALLYELDEGKYAVALRKAVLDRLLPGRGVVWVRYEPKFMPIPAKTQEPAKTDATPAAGSDASAQPDEADKPTEAKDEVETPQEEVASESTPVDYVNWEDFFTSPARSWEEVWWIAKRVYMTREEMSKRFGAKIGEQIPLDWSPDDSRKNIPGTNPDTGSNDGQKRAKILEIWDKSKREVIWIAEKWSDEILDKKPDQLQLHDFWPVPKPLFATTTNSTLIPIPDYIEYQDQAIELDDLTTRIAELTKAIKNAGIYDASIPELGRLFEEGFENRLVPSDNMTEFMTKAGPSGMGAIWLLPIKEMAGVLSELYAAREHTKQVLYEITGISDIVRGQASTGGAKTATEQQIKSQFASMRLNDMQGEVARFCRDTLRIMGEIIAEHFDPMTLFLVSGFEQYAKDQWPPEPALPQPPPQQQPPMMGHNGGPTLAPQPPQPGPVAPPAPPPGAAMGGPPPGMPPNPNAMPAPPPQMGNSVVPFPGGGAIRPPQVPPPIDPRLVAAQKAEKMFRDAVALLKNDKLRGFRIEIETDSLVEPDQKATQQARTELLGAIAQFLPQAMQAGMMDPALKPLMARLLMFFLRGFKASRDIETAFEQFIDDVTKEAANPAPKPPSPEQMRVQAEMAKQAAESQRMQQQAQIDQQKGQMQLEVSRETHRMKLEQSQAELEIKRQELLLDQQRLAMREREMQLEMAAVERAAQINGAVAIHKANLQAQTAEHKASLATTS